MPEKTLAYHLLQKFEADREKIERYSSIAEHCPLPAFIAGSDGISILYINPAYRELTGRNIEELQDGKWVTSVIHPDDQASVIDAWKLFTKTVQRQAHHHRYVHVDGRVTDAVTVVDRVEGNGYVGFIIPHCGKEDCPMQQLVPLGHHT
jgi:PAS domain S-box-containing protein